MNTRFCRQNGALSRLPLSMLIVAEFALGTVLMQDAIPSTQRTSSTVTTLLTRELTDIANKEGVIQTVEYPPGFSSQSHRHHAHAFVFVLEGTVVMQVSGQPPVVLRPGQVFCESPN